LGRGALSLLLAILLAASAEAPCAITGESIDADPAGLRVHAEPRAGSRIVGKLYPGMDPHVFFHEEKPTLAEGLVGANFTVEAVDGDWLRIADVDPVTDGIAPVGSLELVPNVQGSGWVHASMVRLIPTIAEDLRTAPDGPRADAALFAGLDARIVGCRGAWAQLRLDGGGAGWLPSRSNQARAAKIGASLQPKAGAR
jgi:hypothetical protein